jgi:hypothetical protein
MIANFPRQVKWKRRFETLAMLISGPYSARLLFAGLHKKESGVKINDKEQLK